MRIIRVRDENGSWIIKAIIVKGYSAKVVSCPHNREGNGCGNESHCPGSRHESADNPKQLVGIETDCSGNKAHAIIEEARGKK